jgi:enamine deaminase RidA (YjgF/YER057c/UK114 family)
MSTEEPPSGQSIERSIAALGLTLPPPARSVGNYVPYTRMGGLVVSCQGPLWGDELRFQGKVGRELTLNQAQDAARLVLLNLLVQVKAAAGGDLSRFRQCLKLTGFVNSTDTFNQQTLVMNAASDLLVAIFGERGRHARVVAGCNSLPYDLAVEIEGMFEIA